ncbi:MAG: DUF3108 domain-containing protein [Gemmatimonadota bacterium]|nr:MAG: DUF3108 domain-containing protein [Gemmatimonadota bacterium]
MRYATKVALLVLLAAATNAAGQTQVTSGEIGAAEVAPVPFGVGERLDYRVKFGPLKVGQAFMAVEGVDSVAGHPTYHLRSVIEGGTPFYKLNDKQESWLDVTLLASRRYRQDSQQGSYERYREYEFDLEGRTYVRNDGATDSIPALALDEASFVYVVRAAELKVGETYEWNRYYRFDRNPVIVKVLRREKVEVPAGEFNTIVVRPIIKTGGIFAEGGEAEVYLTDDERRLLVRLKTKLKVGNITLDLTQYEPGERLTNEMLGR